MMFRRLVFVFTLSFLLTSLSAQEKAPFTLSAEAQEFIASLPPQMKYGWVEVPEKYDEPEGKKIHIFYYWRPVENSKAVPVTFFNGGPGFTSHKSYHRVISRLHGAPLVFIDQRGTGASSPYPELKEDNINIYEYYLSRSIVHDAEAVRKKLFGSQKWIVTGSSFGSLISQRYIALFPNSLKSSHGFGWAAYEKPMDIPLIRLRKHKEVLDKYFEKFPEMKPLFANLKKSLGEYDYLSTDGFKMDKNAMMGFYGLMTISFPSYWDMSNSVIKNQMVDPSGNINKINFNRFMYNLLFQYMHMSERTAVINIIFNRKEGYVTGNTSLSAHYEKLFETLKKEGNDPHKWLIPEEALGHHGLSGKIIAKADKVKLINSDPLKPEDIFEGLNKNKDLKLFLYSGEMDTLSPPEIFSSLNKQTHKQITYENLKDCGHEGAYVGSNFWDPVRESSGSSVYVKSPENKELMLITEGILEAIYLIKFNMSYTRDINAFIKGHPKYGPLIIKHANKNKQQTREFIHSTVQKYFPHELKDFESMK